MRYSIEKRKRPFYSGSQIRNHPRSPGPAFLGDFVLTVEPERCSWTRCRVLSAEVH